MQPDFIKEARADLFFWFIFEYLSEDIGKWPKPVPSTINPL